MINCPSCNDTINSVLDSGRPYIPNENAIRRMRRCDTCGTRFRTLETIDTRPNLPPVKLSKVAMLETKLLEILIDNKI